VSNEAELLQQMQAVIQQTMAVTTMQGIVKAYDDFARAAMVEVISGYDAGSIDANQAESIAREAWLIADAMMAERKKRGLGGFNNEAGGGK
jgi:cytochrome c553